MNNLLAKYGAMAGKRKQQALYLDGSGYISFWHAYPMHRIEAVLIIDKDEGWFDFARSVAVSADSGTLYRDYGGISRVSIQNAGLGYLTASGDPWAGYDPGKEHLYLCTIGMPLKVWQDGTQIQSVNCGTYCYTYDSNGYNSSLFNDFKGHVLYVKASYYDHPAVVGFERDFRTNNSLANITNGQIVMV